MFLKPKLHKESKNGFKTINFRRYPVMIFSKNSFRSKKIIKKIGRFVDFWIFLTIYVHKENRQKVWFSLDRSVFSLFCHTIKKEIQMSQAFPLLICTCWGFTFDWIAFWSSTLTYMRLHFHMCYYFLYYHLLS